MGREWKPNYRISFIKTRIDKDIWEKYQNALHFFVPLFKIEES